MKRVLMKDSRITVLAMTSFVALLGTGMPARAECQKVAGTMKETIIPSPNDTYGRTLGTVDGVLKGVSTAVVTSPDGSKSSDVIVTNRGDILTGTGAINLAPVPGNSTEFTVNVILTITGGSGRYSGATGSLNYMGLAQFSSATTGTFDLIYRGSVCGPNIKTGEN